jgi:tetratricopeptide (TPR) repeat protein
MAVLALALGAPFCLPAQSSATPSTGNKTDSASKPDFSQQPAIVEYIHVSMRYENDGSGTRETRSRIRVQSPAGLTAAGQLVFEYNAIDEQVEIKSVRVLKADGSAVTAGPEAVQDLSAPVAREAPMYTDARQKHVTVPGVSVGDVVEYDVITKAQSLMPGQFWQIWSFSEGVIALDEQLDLNVPKDRTLKIKSSEGIVPSISVEGDRRLYHWATSNLKTPEPIDIFKDFKFDVIKALEGHRSPPAPRVMFSTFQSWSEVGDWYAQLERERRAVTLEIHAKADEIVRGQQTDEAKAEALYYWVSQNIRYVSLSFGVGRYQPHPAAEVLTNRYGDCKDKTTLLEAMLEAEGIKAHPVLANGIAEIDPEMPNPLQFDHVYTLLQIGDKETWVDTTLGVGPFGYLAPQLRGKEALVVSAATSSGLRKAPEDIPLTVEYRIGINGTVDDDGNLDASVEFQTRGDLEVLIRLLNDHLPPEQLAKAADSLLERTNKTTYASVQYTDFKVVNSSDISHPLKAQFHIAGKLVNVNPKKETPEQLTIALTSLPISKWQFLSLLPAAESKPDSSGKPQQLPVDLKGPKIYALDLNLAFATLVAADLPPAKEIRITQGFAEYESSDFWKGNTFHASRSLALRVPTVSLSDSKEYAAFVQKIVEATAISEATSNTSGPASRPSANAYVPATEAQDLYRRGEEEYKRKNWSNAIEAFGSAVKADPKYAAAWRELGRAQMAARQYPAAETTFRKYLDLAPDDHQAYWNLTSALRIEGKYELEENLLVKRIAVAPTEGGSLFRLGEVYLELHRPEQAVPFLERAAVQLPNYTFGQLTLGRAYLETGQNIPALETFRKVIVMDDSENMLNSVAYALSEYKSSLDSAQEWSQRSIEVVERELNNSSLSNVQSQTWALVVKLGQFWDTMGWIKFQQGKTDAAEKYILAAWRVTDDLTIGMHLGRIYEAQNRKDDAMEMYLAALNTFPSDGPLSDDAKDTRKRLSDILGSNSQVDDRLKEYRKKKSPSRTVTIANPGGAQGIAQYTVIIDANSKVVDLAATGSDDPLAILNDAIRAASMPQSFPDDTLKSMPRLSTLACAADNQPCIFTLLPASSASRLVPLN